jgi:hypothetical protein
MKKAVSIIVAAVFVITGLGRTSSAQSQTPTAQRAQPIRLDEVPKRKPPAPIPPRGTYKPPRTPWGDPDIAGAYNNSDESGIPFERPDEFAGRTLQSFTQPSSWS